MEKKISKESILAILFLILTFATFFMKGMFFEGEQFLYMGLLGIFSAIVFLLIPSKQPFGNSMDWFVLGIVIVYGITLFTAIYFRNAAMELLKYVSCFLVYLIAKRLLTDKKTWLLTAVYLGGVIMSFIGLGAASGAYFISGAYDSTKNLVMSLFQYHNTSALVLACVFLFGLSLYQKTKKLWMKLLLCAGNMIALLTVVFSESRGTWLLFPIMLFLYFWFLPKGQRHISVPLLGTILSVGIFMRGTGNALASQNTAICIIYMLASVLVAVLLGFLFETFLSKIRSCKAMGIWVFVVVIILAVLFLLFGKYILPQSIFHRLTTFNFESRTVTERLTFYRDAFSVFKEYPIFGIGGGGWPYIYGAYQSYRYLANSPHSFLLHLMVEAGFLGVLVFLYFIITLIRYMIKLLKSKSDARIETAPFLVAVISIFLHSMIDIDFSYFTVTTLTWILLAMLSGFEPSKLPNVSWLKWLGLIVSILIAVCGVLGKVAWNNYYKTAEFMQTDANQAYKCVSKAVSIDPSNSMYSITKGNIAFHLAAANTDQYKLKMYADEARNTLEHAYQNNPNDHLLVNQLATFYVNISEFEKGCELIDRLLNIQPLNKESYLQVARIYETVGQICQKNGDMDGVKKAMGRLATLWDEQKAICEEKGWSFEMDRATKDSVLQAIRIMDQFKALEEKK
ncbi:MAG: hypothetical protein E7399_04550 [Ruminococcaceae bacterium]|nr:hypothetical protein [Oscillospiraceae bacterium]